MIVKADTLPEIFDITINKTVMSLKPYPHIVCFDCGLKASGGKSFDCSSVYKAKCQVCGEEKECTETRDFFYPHFEGHEYRKPNKFDDI